MTGEVVTEMITAGDDVKHYIYVSSYYNEKQKNRLDELIYTTQFRGLFESFKKDKISFSDLKRKVEKLASKLGIKVVVHDRTNYTMSNAAEELGLSDEREL